MKNLFIIGYMASGKTTFGRALASETGREFIDLDHEMEEITGRDIPTLIEKIGIAAFRELERNVLRSLGHKKGAVISCGGGTPCYYDNIDFMNETGTTLWLTASPGRIAERVLEAGPTRPLLAGIAPEKLREEIERHLEERLPYYSRANLVFSGEHLENEEEIAGSVARFLSLQ